MDYVACLKTGLNDVKALINLEENRKKKIAPLLELRGKETDKHFSNFLSGWGEHTFFLDFSQNEPNNKDSAWLNELLCCDNEFEKKQELFDKYSNRKNMIPVISWQEDDNIRDIVQFALKTERKFEEIALRVNANNEKAWIYLNILVSSINNLSNTTIIFDFQTSPPAIPDEAVAFLHKISKLSEYGIKQFVLLSTSFPTEKPRSGNTDYVSCTDYYWQKYIADRHKGSKIIYGDYAATNPFSVMEYVPGMIVIPFACYFTPFEWWMSRDGEDKEYIVFREIAKEIISLPIFQGKDYCWATREIAKIAELTPDIEGQHGTNGTWNGFKSNQHMCTILEYLTHPPTAQTDEDEE